MAGKRDKKDKTREKWRKGRNKNIIRYEKRGWDMGQKIRPVAKNVSITMDNI